MTQTTTTEQQKHKWTFYRYGGLDQVGLLTPADLLALDELDPKLWAAMTCPAGNLEYDQKTLQYLDSDGDGRIKIPEVIAAVKWTLPLLKDQEDIFKGEKTLPLDAINQDNPDGKALWDTATQVLRNLGKPDAKEVTIEDLADTQKIFAATSFNGDGVITPEGMTEDDMKTYVKNIMDCIGHVPDRSGKNGISENELNLFTKALSEYEAWYRVGEEDKTVFMAGADTEKMADASLAIHEKLDDYFIRCQLASYDKNFETANKGLEQEYLSLLKTSLSTATEELRNLPIALLNKSGELDLTKNLNPAWSAELTLFLEVTVKKICGEDVSVITQTEWNLIKNKLAPFYNWRKNKKGSAVEKLGIVKVRELLNSDSSSRALELIKQDKALEPEFNRINNVDKLIRYRANLLTFLRNFVSFKNFYDKKERAIFQIGTLYIDSRSFELCIKVDDIAKHSSRATTANTFLMYCECTNKVTNEKMNIVAAVTDGDAETLIVGRNGIFVDLKNRFWDAVIIKTIEHPTSVRQAFWQPYRKLGKMVNEQLEKFAASKDKAITENIAKQTQAPVPATKPGETNAFDVGKFAGIFAAVGLALATIGSALASLISGFMKLTFWQMPLAIAGILLLISGPSMFMTFLKLRKRSLGPILDANGWAINTKAKINMLMGRHMTQIAAIPKGSIRSFDDPFEKRPNWFLRVFIVLLLIILLVLAIPVSRNYTVSKVKKTFGIQTEAEKAEAAQKPAEAPAASETPQEQPASN